MQENWLLTWCKKYLWLICVCLFWAIHIELWYHCRIFRHDRRQICSWELLKDVWTCNACCWLLQDIGSMEDKELIQYLLTLFLSAPQQYGIWISNWYHSKLYQRLPWDFVHFSIVWNCTLVNLSQGMCIKIRNILFAGPPFSELLKPEIVVPLLENLQLKECLVTYLPEVHLLIIFSFPLFHFVSWITYRV